MTNMWEMFFKNAATVFDYKKLYFTNLYSFIKVKQKGKGK